MAVPHADDDYCYLTTTGRRTGLARRIEIWFAAEGDTLYMLAGAGHRSDWVRNITADPSVRVDLGGDEHVAHARILESGDESERARSLVFAKYQPRNESDLSEWRERALPVAIDLTRTA